MENNKYKRILKNLIKSIDYNYTSINNNKLVTTECRISFDFNTLYLNIIDYKELGIDISSKMLKKLIKNIQSESIYMGRNYDWIAIGEATNTGDVYNKEIGEKLAYTSATSHLYNLITLVINTLYKKYTTLLSELDDELDYMEIRKKGIENYRKSMNI